ncbi:hypothetical protein BJY04DRAFT_230441 [Aspergillus karnatakaensis]|uniref:uncharacterized protein n=1 Tax=Aspergillus karnatakaensis TaxID=1810916 RepID=UPI003CCCDB63
MGQPKVTPLPSNIDLTGKTAMITGATAGLGLETARQLLTLKLSTLIIAVRNVSKGESCARGLLSDPNIHSVNPNATINILEVDMESYASIQSFAHRVRETIPVLDYLVLNAGIIRFEFKKTIDGHEQNMQVNYYANALLLAELLPYLTTCAERRSSPVRITWLGSRMYYRSHTLNNAHVLNPAVSVLSYMDSLASWNSFRRYNDTKLLAAMFVYELAPRLDASKVLLNIVCPGMVHTGLSDHGPWYLTLIAGVMKAMNARTIEVGGSLIVNAIVVAGGQSHGALLGDKEIVEPTEFMKSDKGQELQKRLWNETVEEIRKYMAVPEVFVEQA